jgi:transcriptional regulator GlxA family with amidase domain
VTVRACALALDGVVTFDLGCAVQTLGRGAGRDGVADGFTLTTCGVHPGRVRTPDGFLLEVEHGLEAVAAADLVVVPGRFPHDAPAPPAVLDALRSVHERGATVMSICIGAFVLAQAGLLDGRTATTHWDYCADLAGQYPEVDVRPDVLYVDEADVLTSAGLAAGLDLCLHVVRRHAGAAVAARLASWNVTAPHRDGGQAQFIPPSARPAAATGLGPTLAWACDRLGERLAITDLARHAHMSVRTFNRRFAGEVGCSPKQWLTEQRVARARELLESSDDDVERIAQLAGFPSTAALREHLRRRVGLTPTAYRRVHRGGDA